MMRHNIIITVTLLSANAYAFSPSPLSSLKNLNTQQPTRKSELFQTEEAQDNFFVSFLNNIQSNSKPVQIETEEEKQRRLRKERLVAIEEGEVRRQNRVAEE